MIIVFKRFFKINIYIPVKEFQFKLIKGKLTNIYSLTFYHFLLKKNLRIKTVFRTEIYNDRYWHLFSILKFKPWFDTWKEGVGRISNEESWNFFKLLNLHRINPNWGYLGTEYKQKGSYMYKNVSELLIDLINEHRQFRYRRCCYWCGCFWWFVDGLWMTFRKGTIYNGYQFIIHNIIVRSSCPTTKALSFVYAFTGCNIVSAFVRRAKTTAWQAWNAFVILTEVFRFLRSLCVRGFQILKFSLWQYGRTYNLWTVRHYNQDPLKLYRGR